MCVVEDEEKKKKKGLSLAKNCHCEPYGARPGFLNSASGQPCNVTCSMVLFWHMSTTMSLHAPKAQRVTIPECEVRPSASVCSRFETPALSYATL